MAIPLDGPGRQGVSALSQPIHDECFARLTGNLEEGVLLLRDEAVWLCNPVAQTLLAAAGGQLRGRSRTDLLLPAPPRPGQGQQIAFAGREKTPRGLGPQLRGLACGLEAAAELWLLKPEQSLSELGALAAGLLHNLSGPLSIIRSTAELMDRYLRPLLTQAPPAGLGMAAWPASLHTGLARIVEQVDQITNSARDLLAKMRGEAGLQSSPLDLNEIMQRELLFLESEPFFHKNIEKELNLAPGLPRVWGLYSDFSQSFRNLLRNAAQAMAASPERVLGVATRLAPGHILITISDTGRGIGEQDKERVFEPFFTTGGGEGFASGLGLYSVSQLLKPYQVRFEVESRPGRTVFSLRVPLGHKGDRHE